MLILIGSPKVEVDTCVGLPNLAMFLGAATGALTPIVELEDDDERDDDGRASIAFVMVCCV
jgi:hypothetical protein